MSLDKLRNLWFCMIFFYYLLRTNAIVVLFVIKFVLLIKTALLVRIPFVFMMLFDLFNFCYFKRRLSLNFLYFPLPSNLICPYFASIQVRLSLFSIISSISSFFLLLDLIPLSFKLSYSSLLYLSPLLLFYWLRIIPPILTRLPSTCIFLPFYNLPVSKKFLG